MPPRRGGGRGQLARVPPQDHDLLADAEMEALNAELARVEAQNRALAEEVANLQAQARPVPIRTHLPDKFEGRKDDLPQFLDDVRSYCELTNVPAAKRVDYAVRCLGKTVQRVWASKLAVYQRQNPDAVITLDVFGELLSSVYDNSDRVTRARDKLDNVYQGRESIEKYVERFTTLAAEVEVGGDLSVGEKLHRFRKGLREDLKKVAAIDPTTGRQYEDLDALILTLTRYEAALGGQERRPRGGAASAAATDGGGPDAEDGQERIGQEWTGYPTMPPQQYYGFNPYAAPMMVPHHFMPFMAAGALPMPSSIPHRRDGLPPDQRKDGRVAPPEDAECWSCGLLGHEKWGCPWKFMREQPDSNMPSELMATLKYDIRNCHRRGKRYPYMPEGRHLRLMRAQGARVRVPQAAPLQWHGNGGRGRGGGNGWRGRGRGRGRGGRGNRRGR
jgi:hypothetical protein